MLFMDIAYEYSTWREDVGSGGDTKIQFSGRGLLSGEREKIKLFTAPIRPHYIAFTGEKIRGVIVEEEDDEYAYFVLLWEQGVERIKIRLVVRGRYSTEIFSTNRYSCRVNWVGRHIHVLVFPGKFSARKIRPSGYRIARTNRGLEVSWLWSRGFRGLVTIVLSKAT